MGTGSVGLSWQELGPVGIVLFQSLASPSTFEVTVPSLKIVSVHSINLSACSSLGFLDIVGVKVSEGSETSKEKGEPSLTLVIESVGLVPIGELPNILMG